MKLTIRTPPLLAALALVCGVAAGQTLVADIESAPSSGDTGSEPFGFTSAGGVTYFAATTPQTGRELWRSDGTAAGTTLVADIAPGTAGSAPRLLGALPSGELLFAATTPTTGEELWITDGTTAGTALVADVFPGQGSSIPRGLVVVDDVAYGFFDDGVHGVEPWVTDGTPGGTSLVVDALPGPQGHVGFVVDVGDTVYIGSRDALGATTLYAEPPGGPAALYATIAGSTEFTPFTRDVAAVGSHFVFEVDTTTHGLELWTSDGTAGGTQILHDAEFAADGKPEDLISLGDVAFFTLDALGLGREVWRTDGTVAGTSPVGEVVPGPAWGAMDEPMLAFGGGVVFVAASNDELWFTDGAAPTLLVDPDGVTSVDLGVAVGGQLVFTAGASGLGLEPWITDGTPGGTQPLGEVAPGPDSGFPFGYAPTAGGVLFAAQGAGLPREPWFADLSGGVSQVAELYVDPQDLGSNPRAFTTVGDRTFFIADTQAAGSELFVTDGTTAGTQLVADIRPGPGSPGIQQLTALDDRVVFFASDGTGSEPWISDGTPAGTFELLDINPITTGGTSSQPFAVLDGFAYFSADDKVAGPELWRTDGTSAGTELFVELSAGSDGGNPVAFAVIGDRMYFGAQGEPWITDGTPSGTHALGDVSPGPRSPSSPTDFTAFGELVVFAATRPDVGRELFVTDGTPDSATLLADLVPGTAWGVGSAPIVLGERVVLATAESTPELVAVDASGSVTLLTTGPQGVFGPLGALGDERVVFWVTFGPAFDGPTKLWSSDGTPAGTGFVAAIDGTGGGFLQAFAQPGSDARVVFTANDLVHGAELWVSDGTHGGTQRLTDIAAGPPSSQPLQVTRLADTLLFGADDGASGRELWSLPLVDTGAWVAETIGGGCPGSGDVVPTVTTSGAAADGEAFSVGLADALPSSPAYLAASTSVDTLATCALVPSAPLLVLLATDASGEITVPFVPDASFVGLRVVLQWATLDPAGGFVDKASLSPALEVVFGP